jgi:hypothetical protein
VAADLEALAVVASVEEDSEALVAEAASAPAVAVLVEGGSRRT